MCLISAQLEMAPVQFAFRFPTKAKTRQLIPGQQNDHVKQRPLFWLECGAVFRKRKRDLGIWPLHL